MTGYKFKRVLPDSIAYRRMDKHWRYLTTRTYRCRIPLRGKLVRTKFISLSAVGELVIEEGYASDGPTLMWLWGLFLPRRIKRAIMRGAWFHDALYQLLRMKELPPECRIVADQVLYEICRFDGVGPRVGWCIYRAVRMFGRSPAKAGSEKPARIERIP